MHFTGLTTAQLQYGLPAGFNGSIWKSNPDLNGGEPSLVWQGNPVIRSEPLPNVVSPPVPAAGTLPSYSKKTPSAYMYTAYADGSAVTTGNYLYGWNGYMLMPQGVSLANDIQQGLAIAGESYPTILSQMTAWFYRGSMDYQYTSSKRIVNGKKVIDQLFIDFTNFDYGIVAAAVGFTPRLTFTGAFIVNLLGSGNKSGYHYSNPNDDFFIFAGYNAFLLGQVNQYTQ